MYIDLSRRSFFRLGIASGSGVLIGVPKILSAACERTSVEQEGPFYLPNPSYKTNTGDELTVGGVVREANTCAIIPGAYIERWHASKFGIYDDEYRCAMIADSQGVYQFTSVMPGLYGGLQRHIHFRIEAIGYRTLVTQLYMADVDPASTAVFDIYLERG